MVDTKKSRRGRPPLPPGDRKRNALTIRLRDATKEKLEASAVANNRGLGDEAERLLARALDNEGFLAGLPQWIGGQALAAVLSIVGRRMLETAVHSAAIGKVSHATDAIEHWHQNGFAYHRALLAAVQTLEAMRPEDPVTLPESLRPFVSGDNWQEAIGAISAGPPLAEELTWSPADLGNPFLMPLAARVDSADQTERKASRAKRSRKKS